jgi:hypothetical protein
VNAADAPYPADLAIEYPDRDLDRVSTLLRPLFVVPIAVILALISGGRVYLGHAGSHAMESGGGLFLAVALMLAFRGRYPRWWYDWNVAVTAFSLRVLAYATLLTDRYPSTEDAQGVRLSLPYPDVPQLSRGLPLVKWFLAIPHYFVLGLLGLGAWVCVVVAWFAILFTGRYPRILFDFVVDVIRWGVRVSAYAFLLTTDRYPPFSLTD